MRKARPVRAKDTVQEVLGRNILELREAAGMSQEKLAARAGLSRGYISRIECGRVNVTLSTVQEIATVFSLDVSDLLTRY